MLTRQLRRARMGLDCPNNAKPISVTDLAVLKEHIIRLRFDAYRPPSSARVGAHFDFYVEEVYLHDQAKWDEICAQPRVIAP